MMKSTLDAAGLTTLRRLAASCSFWIVIASAAAAAQPAHVVSTLQVPGTEGKWETFRQITTETRAAAPDVTRSTRVVVGFGLERRPSVAERIESTQQVATDGRITVVRNAWAPDLDGRLHISFQEIEEIRPSPPDLHESIVTTLVPDPDRRLREVQRMEYSARRTAPGVTQHDTTQLVRDVNGRWRFAETRTLVVRDIGPSERIEEETIAWPDYGTTLVSERHITRRSEAGGREEVVTETYAPGAHPGFEARLGLSVRVRTSTTAEADGGQSTVEEEEAFNPAAPAEPLRVTRRTVTTVRRAGPDRWATERRVFGRDVNGRMVPIETETEESGQ